MNKTLTPKPIESVKETTMDFPDAMREVIKGNKVTRLSWGNKDYGHLKNGWLSIYTKGNHHTWLVNDGDMEANDWVITIK